MKPRISCLTSTYGRVSRLCECLAFFILQDYLDAELIIVNTAPQKLETDLSTVHIHNIPGLMLPEARRKALSFAQGQYINTWDDDDWWMPWHLSQAITHLEACGLEAWKPKRSWFFDEGNGTFCLQENVMEASMLTKISAAQIYGYKEGIGDEHETLCRGMQDRGMICVEEMGPRASYCYAWNTGLWHASGTLGNGQTLEQRDTEWKKHHDDFGDGSVLRPADVSPLYKGLLDYLDDSARSMGAGLPYSEAAVLHNLLRDYT